MAIKSNHGENTMFTEINITPLTDIFLVLLILMMVVAPTFQSVDNTIKVPEINSGIAIEHKEATISITKEGSYYINGTPISSDAVESELEKLKPSLEKKEVVVKADEKTKSKEILSVMQAAQNAGYEKLVVAGEPLSKREQDTLKSGSMAGTNKVSEEG